MISRLASEQRVSLLTVIAMSRRSLCPHWNSCAPSGSSIRWRRFCKTHRGRLQSCEIRFREGISNFAGLICRGACSRLYLAALFESQISCDDAVDDPRWKESLNESTQKISAYHSIPNVWVASCQRVPDNFTHLFRRKAVFSIADHICPGSLRGFDIIRMCVRRDIYFLSLIPDGCCHWARTNNNDINSVKLQLAPQTFRESL